MSVGGGAVHPFELLPDPVLCLDRSGVLVAANAAARARLELDPGALAGGGLTATLAGGDGAGGWARVAEDVARKGRARRVAAVGDPDRRVDLVLTPYPVGGAAFAATCRPPPPGPVDSQVPEPELFATILGALREVVFVRDPDGRLVFCNPSLERVTGYRPEEILDVEDLVAIFHPDDLPAFFATVARWEAGETGLDFVGRYRHRDGSWRWFRNRAAAAEVAGQARFVSTVDDITDLKATEAALRETRDELERRVRERTRELEGAKAELEADIAARERAEAQRDRYEVELRRTKTLEAMGQLAGGVAHDFNNLLASVLSCLYVARRRAAGDPEVVAELDRAQGLCRDGGELTRQLLTVARRRAGRPEVVSLGAVLGELRLILRRTLPRTIELAVPPGGAPPLRVRADRSLLTAALLNLGLNARDAMPSGGTLTVAARAEAGPDGAGWAVVEVADTGVGIPPEQRERVFEPFFTTKGPERGSGLGLPMVQATVQECGGELSLWSEVGAGTRVTLRLPVAAEAAEAPETRTARGTPEAAPGLGGEVLVVEDEEDVARMVRGVLDGAGCRTLRARDGLEALELLRRHRETVDLVTLDLLLPQLDGAQVFRLLQSLAPDVPVLFVTGREDLARELDPEAAVLPKPFTAEQLLAAVSGALARGRLGAG